MFLSNARRVFTRGPARRQAHRRAQSTFAAVDHDADIAIIGGGPVGLSLACALSSSTNIRSKLKIALIEGGDLGKSRSWSPQPEWFSNRVSSITNRSRTFLEEIGVWKYVDISRTAPVEEMHVWDGLTDSRVIFSTADITSAGDAKPFTEMAHLTENLNIQRALLRRLEDCAQVMLLENNPVKEIRKEVRGGSYWPVVRLADQRQLRARLLVGADGFNSPVRKYANIATYGWTYDAQAIVATLCHAPRLRTEFQSANTIAYQRFLPTGPIAFLPLSPTASSLVWSLKTPIPAALLACDLDVLSTMINAAFRLPEVSIKYLTKLILESHNGRPALNGSTILDEVKWREKSHAIDPQSAYSSKEKAAIGVPPDNVDMLPPLITSIQSGSVASFPLRFNHADTYMGEGEGGRTVLIGDAAHTVHPLAGQGLNMGLADVQALTHCIESAVSIGGDIGSFTSLLPYSRDRYYENHKILSVTDKLHKLYGSTFGPVVQARSTGLEVVNELSTVKAALMYSAGANNVRAVRNDALGWNFAASGARVLAEGYELAKVFLGSIEGLASSATASSTRTKS